MSPQLCPSKVVNMTHGRVRDETNLAYTPNPLTVLHLDQHSMTVTLC